MAASEDGFPVTVEHLYGETVVAEPPTRVATVSWVNADVSIALGVVPVGMPRDDWGGNEQGSTPWEDAALEEAGAALGTEGAPTQYAETDGIDDAAIAALTADLILGACSGLTEECLARAQGEGRHLTGRALQVDLVLEVREGPVAHGPVPTARR